MMNIVLVTGGTKGIGKAIVLKYLHQGCYAIITYSSDDETAELFQRELDVNYNLILNAGATNRNSFSDMTIDEWNYVINVNLTMPFFIVQSLVDCIIKGGSILFIGAVMGIYPHAISIPYAVSKAGVHMLSRQLVKHLAPYKITVNTIAPGFVDTPWQKSKPLEQRIRIENKIALKRFALPEEIAQLCWDISQNAYINGSLLEIDGGYCYE